MLIKYFGPSPHIYAPNRFSTWHACDSEEHYEEYSKNTTARKEDRWTLEWGYQFNSAGFRSEEYDPKATKRIATIGCSYTLGEGIPFEATWSQQFKKLYEQDHKTEIVNALNFAQSGGSNDYIARMVLTQLKVVPTDILIVQFSYIGRAEYVIQDNRIDIFGAWEGNSRSKAYFALANDKTFLIKTLKNMLQIQFFCKENNIEFIFSLVEYKWLNSKLLNDPQVKLYFDLLDLDSFTDFSIEGEGIKCDVGRDIGHPGPVTNKRFADALYSFYKGKRK